MKITFYKFSANKKKIQNVKGKKEKKKRLVLFINFTCDITAVLKDSFNNNYSINNSLAFR